MTPDAAVRTYVSAGGLGALREGSRSHGPSPIADTCRTLTVRVLLDAECPGVRC
jgi:hypothetical protein